MDMRFNNGRCSWVRLVAALLFLLFTAVDAQTGSGVVVLVPCGKTQGYGPVIANGTVLVVRGCTTATLTAVVVSLDSSAPPPLGLAVLVEHSLNAFVVISSTASVPVVNLSVTVNNLTNTNASEEGGGCTSSTGCAAILKIERVASQLFGLVVSMTNVVHTLASPVLDASDDVRKRLERSSIVLRNITSSDLLIRFDLVECNACDVSMHNLICTVAPIVVSGDVRVVLLFFDRSQFTGGRLSIENASLTATTSHQAIAWIALQRTVVNGSMGMHVHNVTMRQFPAAGAAVTSGGMFLVQCRNGTISNIDVGVSGIVLISSPTVSLLDGIVLITSSTARNVSISCVAITCQGTATTDIVVVLVQFSSIFNSTLTVDSAALNAIGPSLVRCIESAFDAPAASGGVQTTSSVVVLRSSVVATRPLQLGAGTSFASTTLVNVVVMLTEVAVYGSVGLQFTSVNISSSSEDIVAHIAVRDCSMEALYPLDFEYLRFFSTSIVVENSNLTTLSSGYTCLLLLSSLFVNVSVSMATVAVHSANYAPIYLGSMTLQQSAVVASLTSSKGGAIAYVLSTTLLDGSAVTVDASRIKAPFQPPATFRFAIWLVQDCQFTGSTALFVMPNHTVAPSTAAEPLFYIFRVLLDGSALILRGVPQEGSTPSTPTMSPSNQSSIRVSTVTALNSSVIAVEMLLLNVTSPSKAGLVVILSTFSDNSTLRVANVSTIADASNRSIGSVLLRQLTITARSTLSIVGFDCAMPTDASCLFVDRVLVENGSQLTVHAMSTRSASVGLYASVLEVRNATFRVSSASWKDTTVALLMESTTFENDSVVSLLDEGSSVTMRHPSCAQQRDDGASCAVLRVVASSWDDTAVSVFENATVDAGGGYGMDIAFLQVRNAMMHGWWGASLINASYASSFWGSSLENFTFVVQDATVQNASVLLLAPSNDGVGHVHLALHRCNARAIGLPVVSVSGAFEHVALCIDNSSLTLVPTAASIAVVAFVALTSSHAVVLNATNASIHSAVDPAATVAVVPVDILLANLSMRFCSMALKHVALGAGRSLVSGTIAPDTNIKFQNNIAADQHAATTTGTVGTTALLLQVVSSTLHCAMSAVVLQNMSSLGGALDISLVASTIVVMAADSEVQRTAVVRVLDDDGWLSASPPPGFLVLTLDRAVLLGPFLQVLRIVAAVGGVVSANLTSIDVYCSWWGRRVGSPLSWLSVSQLRAVAWRAQTVFHPLSLSDPNLTCPTVVMLKPLSGSATHSDTPALSATVSSRSSSASRCSNSSSAATGSASSSAGLPSTTSSLTGTPSQTDAQSLTATPSQTDERSLTATPSQTDERSLTATPSQTDERSLTGTPSQTDERSLTATPSQTDERSTSFQNGSPSSTEIISLKFGSFSRTMSSSVAASVTPRSSTHGAASASLTMANAAATRPQTPPAAVEAVGTVAAITAGLLSVAPIGAFAAQRGRLLIEICRSPDEVMLHPLDAMNHPLQFDTGPAYGAFVRGSIVGNLFVLYGGTALVCVAIVIVHAWRSRLSRGGARVAREGVHPAPLPWMHSASRLRLPGSCGLHDDRSRSRRCCHSAVVTSPNYPLCRLLRSMAQRPLHPFGDVGRGVSINAA